MYTILGIVIGFGLFVLVVNLATLHVCGNWKIMTKKTAPIVERILNNKYLCLGTNGKFIYGTTLSIEPSEEVGIGAIALTHSPLCLFKYYYLNSENEIAFVIPPSYNKQIDFMFKNAMSKEESINLYMEDLEKLIEKDREKWKHE